MCRVPGFNRTITASQGSAIVKPLNAATDGAFQRTTSAFAALVAAFAIGALSVAQVASAAPIPVRSKTMSLDDVDATPYSWKGPCKVILNDVQGYALCRAWLDLHQPGKAAVDTWIQWRFKHTGNQLPYNTYITGACRPSDGPLRTYRNDALAPMGGLAHHESSISSRRSYIAVKFSPTEANVNKSVLERIGKDLMRKFEFYALRCDSAVPPAAAATPTPTTPRTTANAPSRPRSVGEWSTFAKGSAGVGEGDHLSTLGQCWSNEDHPSCRDQATAPTPASSQAARQLFDRGAAAYKSNNYTEAAPNLLAAAQQGHVKAMGYLGHMYENGYGLRKDLDEAFRWFKKAADQGDAFAANNVGRFYRWGWGVEQDMPEAIHWFRYAVEHGDNAAPYNLAYFYLIGASPLPKDPDKAMELYKLSAQRGYMPAVREVGWLYQNGWGATADETEALRWYRKAADSGVLAAMNDLAVYYQEGRGGLRPNPEEALQWFTRAAEEGLDQAMFNLARAYDQGIGTQPNTERAVHWYREAAERGHAGARKRLSVLE